MSKRVTILQAHPDPSGGHFGNALADAYAEGAQAAQHEVRRIEIAKLDFPLLRSAKDYYQGTVPEGVRSAQDDIRWADHLVIVYPLWFGHFPAVFHAFLEQTFRPGFALGSQQGLLPRKLLVGKSARIVVTMGMPGLLYRWYFRSHSLKSFERNILRFAGVRPIRTTLIGVLGSGAAGTSFERDFPTVIGVAARERWLEKLRLYGREGR
jgi:putative NADPH-quinone reductase